MLPYKGSGKHKYSFQRVEVPSTLPLHFCDCEEHCGPRESANQTYLSALDSAAHEKELSIMHSVMNKLLKESGEMQDEMEANPDVELVENNAEEEREEGGEEVVEEVAKEESEEESDEDLVINISSRIADESLLNFKFSDAVPPNQELKERKHQSAEKVSKKNTQGRTSKVLKPTTYEEKPSVTTEKASIDEFTSHLPRPSSSSIENQSKDEPTDQKTAEKSGKSSNTWFQKSAWRDLVGDSAQNLFSTSSSTQLSSNSISSNQPVTENKVNDSTIASKKRKLVSSGDLSITPTETKIVEEDNTKQTKPEVRRVVQKVKVGEVCPFMRSSESEKEWNKAKKALSGYMKKKKDESGNGSGVRKGAPFHGKRFVK